MRYVFLSLLVLSVSVAQAVTFNLETTTGTTTSTSTITVDAPLPVPERAVKERLSTLVKDISEMLGIYEDKDTLLDLQIEFAALAGRVEVLLLQETLTEDDVLTITLELKTLLLKVTELVVQDAVGTTTSRAQSRDAWIQDRIFGFVPSVLQVSEGEQSQEGTVVSVPSASCDAQFTLNMRLGATGEAVHAVQVFLNNDEETRLSQGGVGSLGQETEYFGNLTFVAVKKFQTKHEAAVLESVGLSEATGFWGPSTRKQANKLSGCSQ